MGVNSMRMGDNSHREISTMGRNSNNHLMIIQDRRTTGLINNYMYFGRE